MAIATTVGLVVACADLTTSVVSTEKAATVLPGLSAVEIERAEALMERVKFTGVLHNAAMAELTAKRWEWRRAGVKPTVAERCQALAATALRIGARAFSEAGATVEAAEVRAAVAAAMRRTRCSYPLPMNILGLSSLNSMAAVSAAFAEDDTVTGDFAGPADAMSSAAAATDGTPAAVSSVVNGYLSMYSGLPANDLEVMAGLGANDIASSEYWTAFGQGGGFDSLPEPQSFMRATVFMNPLAIIVGCDILGAVGGTASAYLGGERRKSYLLAQAVIWAAVGSGGCHLGLQFPQ